MLAALRVPNLKLLKFLTYLVSDRNVGEQEHVFKDYSEFVVTV